MQKVESALAVSEVRWQPCFRVIPSRYPTIHLFERVADPADWEALYWIESLTNPRLRDEVGAIELVPPEERAFGPRRLGHHGAVHSPGSGGQPLWRTGRSARFYAAASLATSVAETCYHREIFLRATRQEPLELDMRSYLADVGARFHDIRGQRGRMSDVYDPDSYISSQVLGRQLKLSGSNGIAYDSVRHPGGECLAIYRPRLILNIRQGVHLRYVWDGGRISRVYELRQLVS